MDSSRAKLTGCQKEAGKRRDSVNNVTCSVSAVRESITRFEISRDEDESADDQRSIAFLASSPSCRGDSTEAAGTGEPRKSQSQTIGESRSPKSLIRRGLRTLMQKPGGGQQRGEGKSKRKGKRESADAMSRQTDAAPTTPKLIYSTKIELPN